MAITYHVCIAFAILSCSVMCIAWDRCYRGSTTSPCVWKRHHTSLCMSSDDVSDNKDALNLANKFYDSSTVSEVLTEIMSTLSKLDVNNDVSINDELSMGSLQSKFDRLYQDVRESTTMSDIEKRLIFTETAMLVEDKRKDQTDRQLSGKDIDNIIGGFQFMNAKTSLYSPVCAPVVIAYGPGKVGQRVCAIARDFGKSADFRLIDAQRLISMQEPDLKYAMRDVRSIIIAADAVDVEKKGWFGAIEVESQPPVINSKGLKRLLNAALADASKTTSRDMPVKVVALAAACKPPKSVASMMFGTDENTELEDEVVLQCMQRGLSYNVIKVGRIIDDDQSIPSNVKPRSVASQSTPMTDEDRLTAQPLYQNPLVFTLSRTIEHSEVTRLSVAAQALMRAVVHPHRNATVSVLSAPTMEGNGEATMNRLPSEAEWADEFLKLDGPELLRIPLRFASIRQAMMKLTRVIRELAYPSTSGSSSSALVTPIKVEKCSGGLRVVFVPKISEYVSTREEKAEQKRIEDVKKLLNNEGNPKRKSGYLSPEEEMQMSMAKQDGKQSTAPAPSKKKPAVPLEGGLEIIVESTPYVRVRVRRCNMEPKTVVKEESETLLLKTIRSAMLALDNDYRLLLKMDKEKLWATPKI